MLERKMGRRERCRVEGRERGGREVGRAEEREKKRQGERKKNWPSNTKNLVTGFLASLIFNPTGSTSPANPQHFLDEHLDSSPLPALRSPGNKRNIQVGSYIKIGGLSQS